MKFYVLIAAIVFACIRYGSGQSIVNDSLDITYDKTTSIVFPFSIKSVDRGSKDVLAQKPRGVENILLLKAARRAFPETNVTVVTADGNLHHFIVNYSDHPQKFCFLKTERVGATNVLFSDGVNVSHLANISEIILDRRNRHDARRDRKFRLEVSLRDIYIQQNVIFYKVRITNKSHLDYDVGALRFYIRDKQKVKRTATQENEVHPIFMTSQGGTINGKSSMDIVYALPKFTIPDAKVLEIDLFEKNGGRNLKLKVSNGIILKAKPINEKQFFNN